MIRWFAASAFIIFTLSMVPAPGSSKAFAQDRYPTRPVKFLIPYPGGGTNDVLARIVGDKLQAKWGQPVIIENRSGGGGNIGAALVAAGGARWLHPDGLGTPPLATNQSLYRGCPTSRKNSCRSQFSDQCQSRDRAQGLPVNSLSELIAHAKANPGKLVYGSQGGRQYSPPYRQYVHDHDRHQHGACAVSRRDAGLQRHAGERVDVFFGNRAGAFAFYQGGQLKVLAVLDKVRSAAMPDVPTSAEVGLPGLVSGVWYAMVGPPKLKPELRDQIAQATIEVLKMPDVQQRFRTLNVEPDGRSPAETAAFIKDEARRWGEVIRANNITAE